MSAFTVATSAIGTCHPRRASPGWRLGAVHPRTLCLQI